MKIANDKPIADMCGEAMKQPGRQLDMLRAQIAYRQRMPQYAS